MGQLEFSEDGTISGYGSVFGEVDSHKDIVDKGAFSESLANWKRKGRMPPMLLMHAMGPQTEDQLPIGQWDDMHEDSQGLFVRGRLALGNRRADDTYALLKMSPPPLNGLSIGYRATRFTKHAAGSKANGAIRTLHAVDLRELSLVGDPSCDSARITRVKSGRTIRDIEAEFRQQGYSNTRAKIMARAAVDDELDGLIAELRDSIRAACS